MVACNALQAEAGSGWLGLILALIVDTASPSPSLAALQTVDVDGIRVTAYRAGHVLGAAMFMVEIGGELRQHCSVWANAA